MRILVVLGTRPEAIKLALLIRRLKKDHDVAVCATSQQRQLLRPALALFGVKPDLDLDLMRPGQTPAQIVARVRRGLKPVLRRRFDWVIAQGDTSSALGAALAARAARIPLAHVEAGLRSHDFDNPRPEESNRVRIDALASRWFAPTPSARRNLLREGHGPRGIYVTGNTGIDALKWALRRAKAPRRARRYAVLTLHRRESFGAPLKRILKAVLAVSKKRKDLDWIFPVHLNPRVRRAAALLRNHERIRLVKPLAYPRFVGLLKNCEFIVTDSGGIQEEAPYLRKPVLVMRKKTDRPESLRCGARLAGVSARRLEKEILRLKTQPPRDFGRAPFGDGRAAARIARVLRLAR